MPSSPAPPPAKAQEPHDPENHPVEGSLAAQQPEAPSSSSDTTDNRTEKSATKPASATAADTEAKLEESEEDSESQDETTREDKAKERQEQDTVEDSSSNPPLPAGPPPAANDDGWDFHWDATNQAYFFHNRFTGQTTWENPRVPDPAATATTPASSGALGTTLSASGTPGTTTTTTTTTAAAAAATSAANSIAGGYNPAIHGDYDPNAWYAQQGSSSLAGSGDAIDAEAEAAQAAAALYSTTGTFNRFTGRFQADDGAEKHTDEAKSKRQMNAFFDVDAAANQHDGRSLKAERSGIKPSKAELKKFKEKRRARKEEKRRAWLKE